jgi:hypothetical protein
MLALGDAAAFAGVLEGLRAGEMIDFLGLDVTSAKASGTTLAIGEAGGATLDLKLASPLPAGTGLVLTSDQHGGTDLQVQAPGG